MGQQRSGPSIEILQPPYVPASVSDGTEIKRFRFGDPRKGKPEVGYPPELELHQLSDNPKTNCFVCIDII